jgi:hypothetical protein
VDAGQQGAWLSPHAHRHLDPAARRGAARQLTHFPADGQQIWGAAFASDGRLAVGRASIKNNIILFRGLKRPAR